MLKLMLLLAYWIYFTYMKLKSKKSLIFYVNEMSNSDEITEKHAKMSNDRVQKILRQPSLFF